MSGTIYELLLIWWILSTLVYALVRDAPLAQATYNVIVRYQFIAEDHKLIVALSEESLSGYGGEGLMGQAMRPRIKS